MIIENYLIQDDWTKIKLTDLKFRKEISIIKQPDIRDKFLIDIDYYGGEIIVRHSTTNSFCISISSVPFRRYIFLKFFPNYHLKYFGTAEQAMFFMDDCLERIKRLIIFS